MQRCGRIAVKPQSVYYHSTSQIFAARIMAAFPGRVRVLEHQSAHLRVAVSRVDPSAPALSDVFTAMEAVRLGTPTDCAPCSVAAYQVSQTSLEQVFLDLAATGGPQEEDAGPWTEARTAFGARAIALHLVVAPCALLVRWGLLLGLLALAVFLCALPPLGACALRALARMLQWRARVDIQLFNTWAKAPAAAPASHGVVPAPVTVTAAGRDERSCCCRLQGFCGLALAARAVFGDPAISSALAYLAFVQPCIVLLCLVGSALTLMLGVGSLAGFMPSLVLQKRLAIWHRELSIRYLCEQHSGACVAASNPLSQKTQGNAPLDAV